MSPTSTERFSAVSWPSLSGVALTDVVMTCPFVGSSPLPRPEFDFQTDSRRRYQSSVGKANSRRRRVVPPSGVGYIRGVDLKDKPTKRICSVADALAIVGDRYSLLIVREIGYGYV